MSRKNFIITALIVNLTICITLCIAVFTDDNKNSNKYSDENIVEEENIKESVGEQETEDANKEEEHVLENEIENDDKTDEIIEDDSQSDASVHTSIDYNGITLTNKEETTFDTQEETTSPQEPTVTIDGTIATIIQSCNIRSQADVNYSNRIGTANIGSNYLIESSLCSANWVAIYLEDGSIGYVSSSFCVIS